MVRKTKEETQETRKRILEAAVSVFYEKGFNLSTLDDIAKEAGMTRGAIYWHFENKKSIFSALHDEMHSGFMDRVLEKDKIEAEDPLKQLEDLCVEILADFQVNEDRRRGLSIFCLKNDYSGEMEEFMKEQEGKKGEARTLVGKFFKKAVQKGILPKNTDSDFLSQALCFYMMGIMNESLMLPSSMDIAKKGRALIEIFFKGLRH